MLSKDGEFMKYDMSFLGLGVSNWSVLKYMIENMHGNYFISSVDRIDEEKKAYLKENNVDFEEGENSSLVLNTKVLVISPSVKPDNLILKRAVDSDIEVKIDIELFFDFLQDNPRLIAITGTNGKTTTVEMITHILKNGYKAYSVGNIGNSAFEYLSENLNDACLIFELSSFQIKHIKNLKRTFNVSGITNIAEDHLEWHGSYENYRDDKLGIKDLSEVLFIPSNNNWLTDSDSSVFFYDDIQTENKYLLPENIKGEHNKKNALLACSCCSLMGLTDDEILKSLASFKFGEHRMEVFLIKNSRTYIDDSKSTNAHSLFWALKSLKGNILLLAGAKDKGDDYVNLGLLISEKVKKTYLCGESSKRLSDCIPGENKEIFGNWDDAIKKAIDESEPGDLILFSPGGSSFDMFTNYKERGRYFKQMVKENT